MAQSTVLTSWIALSREAANELRNDFEAMELSTAHLEELALHRVEASEANGTNSLDELYFERLRRGEHLTDRFLADVSAY